MEGADPRRLAAHRAMRRIDKSVTRIGYGETMLFQVAVQLDGLTPEDLTVEMVFTRPGEPTTVHARRYQLQHERAAGKRRAPFRRAS
jgi:hypothetical protein